MPTEFTVFYGVNKNPHLIGDLREMGNVFGREFRDEGGVNPPTSIIDQKKKKGILFFLKIN